MSKDNKDIEEQIKIRLKVIGSIIIDGVFLLLWFFLTFIISHYFDDLVSASNISDLDKSYILISEKLFSWATFISVISFLFKDVSVLIIRTLYEILDTLKNNNDDDNDE